MRRVSLGVGGLGMGFAGLLVVAAPAYAASPHAPLITAGILNSIFGGIGHAVLGAISWTFGLASKFFLVTLGALVKLLIPRSWAQQGVQLMDWIVQVPNYAGKIATPRGDVYGFRGINELRGLFTWLGVAIGPLTLAVATSRAMASEREHPAAPITRMAALAAVLISYPYWWGQGSALIDQVTHTILSLPAVTDGIHKLMVYAVDGVALGGWQLVDLGLMLAIGIELLMLMFLKVAIILVGALLYATGPLMLGLVPLESGAAVSRAWLAAAATLIMLPVLWATLFAVGGLLIDDAGTAGPLIAGNTAVGNLVGGLLLAVAGLATLWACLRAGREAAGLLRIQLGAMLAGAHALRGGPAGGRAIASTGQRGAQSVREFGQRVSRTTGAAGQALAKSGPRGARIARAGGLAMTAGRRGLLGSAGLAAAAAGRQLVGDSGHARAGVVAMQMARAGCSYKASTGAAAAGRPTPIRQPPRAGNGPGGGTGSGPSTAASTGSRTSAVRPADSPGARSSASTGPSSVPPASARSAPGAAPGRSQGAGTRSAAYGRSANVIPPPSSPG
jgi:hypothetical protein